jgi:hypothetical protein
MKRMSCLALGLLTLLACNKQQEAAPTEAEKPSAAAVTPPAPAPVAEAAPPAVDVDSLPVEEEFEADAEKELTSANLNAKLDELEKEISAP